MISLSYAIKINDRRLVKVLKSLNDRKSHSLLKFKELLSVSCKSLVYARLRERGLGCIRAVTVFKLLNDWQSKFGLKLSERSVNQPLALRSIQHI